MGAVTYGRAEAFCLRWHDCAKPGMYIVGLSARPGAPGEYTELQDVPGYDYRTLLDFGCNFDAVVDDFGRLVNVRGAA